MTFIETILLSLVILLLIVDYFAYTKVRALIIAHNSLMLYHHYFLKSKHNDYGEPPPE